MLEKIQIWTYLHIIQKDLSPVDIKDIEGYYQIKKQFRQDYDWISICLDIKYEKDDLKSRYESRQEEDKIKFSRGETINYPTTQVLEEESKEKNPQILLTIMNSKGDIIRRINANRTKGYNEKYWDLRTFSNRNIDEENNYSGPLVPPGSYTIHLEKFENNILSSLSDKIKFLFFYYLLRLASLIIQSTKSSNFIPLY